MKVRIGNHVLLPLVLAASLVAGEQASLSESEGPGSVVENEDPSASSNDWKYTLVFPMVWAPSIDGSIERVGMSI